MNLKNKIEEKSGEGGARTRDLLTASKNKKAL